MIRRVATCRKLVDLEAVAICFRYSRGFRRLAGRIGFEHPNDFLRHLAVQVEFGSQTYSHAGDAITRQQLHMCEVTGNGRILAVRILQLGKVEVCLNPKSLLRRGVYCRTYSRMEVGTADGSQGTLKSKKSHERNENRGFAGAV